MPGLYGAARRAVDREGMAARYSIGYYSPVKSRRLVLDAYVLDTLMADLVGRERCPSALLVYLHLWGRRRLSREGSARVSLQAIATDTGLSKSAVQGAIRLLLRRRLLRSEHASRTAVPEYFVRRPWKRGPSPRARDLGPRARRLSPRAPAAGTRRPRGRRG